MSTTVVATSEGPAPRDLEQPPEHERKDWVRAGLVGLIVLAAGGALIGLVLAPVDRAVVGITLVALLLLLMVLNVSVGVAMGLAGAIGLYALGGERVVWGALSDIPFSGTAQFTLAVMPMFILMGLLLWRSGVTADVYTAARHWLHWLPGGLGVTTNVAGGGLGAVSGSTIGITFALGRIGIPEMLRAGYSKTIAIGSVMSAGTLGQLIPPSILLVVYAGFAETPIGPQLVAGIVPGLLLVAVYCALIVVYHAFSARKNPTEKPESARLAVKIRDTARTWPMAAIAVVIIGGFTSGLFTATEIGAVGVLVAAACCVARLGPRQFIRAAGAALVETVVAVGTIMFMLMGANILNRALALSGTAQAFSDGIRSLDLTPIMLILVLVVFYFALGAFMDPIPMMLLTTPLILPLVVEAGFSPLWFGVFIVLLGEIAILSPPVGILVFVTHRLVQNPDVGLGQKISLGDVYRAAGYFIPGALVVVLLITTAPELVTWLPDMLPR